MIGTAPNPPAWISPLMSPVVFSASKLAARFAVHPVAIDFAEICPVFPAACQVPPMIAPVILVVPKVVFTVARRRASNRSAKTELRSISEM